MNTILISYDLGGPETSASYEKLMDAIKSLSSNNSHPLDSFWLIKTSYSAKKVREYLMGFLDENDHILVINVSSDDYSCWLRSRDVEWLAANM